MSEVTRQHPLLGLSIYTLKKYEGQEGKTGLFQGCVTVGVGRT
jgi:hypothetical protein